MTTTNKLPENWVEIKLENACEIFDALRSPVNAKERIQRINGKNLSNLYPYYGATGQVGFIDDFIFEGEYLLLGEDGAPFLDPTKNKAFLTNGRFWVNNHAHILKAHISNKYLCFYLNQIEYSNYVAGTTRLKLTQAALKQIPVRLAPEAEQKRIVAKIEELFSEIDKGIESLQRAQELLKAYRQSLLKSAFEGKLTEKWRESESQHIGKGKELLECILKERKQKWKDKKERYKDPLLPDTENLPYLPNGWVWASLDQIMNTSPQNGVYYPQSKYGQGIPILRIDDFQADWTRPIGDLQLVEVNNRDKELYSLNDGDFVINRVNSSSHLGKTICVSGDYSGVLFESNMMRFSISELITEEYLSYYLASVTGRSLLVKNCKHAVNQASINQQDVRATPIPIPSKAEQDQLTQIIIQASTQSGELEKELIGKIRKAQNLRQSILKKAFLGELLPQDSSDEPARVLLERIKAEKAVQTPQKRKSKKLQQVSA
ncbi:MAG: restriction endonuclease subunit S [Rhabdochlamydiaceae bacterium]